MNTFSTELEANRYHTGPARERPVLARNPVFSLQQLVDELWERCIPESVKLGTKPVDNANAADSDD